MKNRLILLSLAMLCYGHMQAEGFVTDQLNRIRSNIRHNYYLQPYWDSLEKTSIAQRIAPYTNYAQQKIKSYTDYLEKLEGYNYNSYSLEELNKLPEQDVARRIASYRYLYKDKEPLKMHDWALNKTGPVTPIQREIANKYIDDLSKKWMESFLKLYRFQDASDALDEKIKAMKDRGEEVYTGAYKMSSKLFKEMHDEERKKLHAIGDQREAFLKSLKRELNAPTPLWLERQHPDYFEY